MQILIRKPGNNSFSTNEKTQIRKILVGKGVRRENINSIPDDCIIVYGIIHPPTRNQISSIVEVSYVEEL